HHRQQGGLAHAGAGEDAQALPGAARREQVERTHAEVDPRAEIAAAMGFDRRRLDRVADAAARQGWPAVQRSPEGVETATEPARARLDARLIARDDHAGADPDAVEPVERQKMHAVGIDRHHLREQRPCRASTLAWVVSRLFDPAGIAQTE